MKKSLLYLLLFLIPAMIPVMNQAGSGNPVPDMEGQPDLFGALNLSQMGLSREVFQLALKGYQKLEHSGRLLNSNILTIIDFSQSSKKKRMFVIDLKNRALLFNTYVAHGRNTGDEFAKYFSNIAGSYKSSLGFFVTKNHATGASVGLSLIIDGVEKGFNDNAIKREIIIHGAAYATENFILKTGRLGRSFGCPSLPPDLIKPVIETIEKGTCLFIYHQDDYYIHHSSLLN
ncbi:MAG: murein L,D-transpeptidase catalytic domain family protein [Bacteroidetes bacterium]|nr:murein L,D-transpeptidase catalytic domain family protein [Bacteroidota bacterium]